MKYYGKALSTYESLISLKQTRPDVYFRKASILLIAIGDSENGIKALEEAILAGYKDKEKYNELVNNPELIEKERVKLFLQDKRMLIDDSTSLSESD